jgi:4-hydroxy-4-methyl-2-oxoglutarate aldolase
VLAVPRAKEEQVLEISTAIAEREDAIVADVLSGTTLAEARRRHGYHLLQRREVQP